jgi:bacterioferritin-associated ferredoxin
VTCIHYFVVLNHHSQCNMQLSLFKSLHTLNRPVPIKHSYDINCQFAVHLWDRVKTLPADLWNTPTPASDWTHCIPKMHIMGHIRRCQVLYSLNFIHGCGRTCGECIERMWALMNGIATSTREMRAGRRADWIDFHMGHHNYMKHCSIGICLSCARVSPTLIFILSSSQAGSSTHGGRSRHHRTLSRV